MGKILVLYHSNSGNTEKMANLVAAGARSIDGMEVRTRHIHEATAEDVAWCDGIACGAPTNMGIISWQMKRFWDETMRSSWMKVDGKLACAFSSSGGWAGGTELACQAMITVLLNFGFLCFGVTDYVGNLMTLHYGAISAREPRNDDVRAACEKLGSRLAEWVAVFVDGRKEEHPVGKERMRPS